MNLEWTTTENLHYTHCTDTNETQIKTTIEQALEKAISLLHHNIQDDSLYFLVEWYSDTSTLNIFVTDDTKQKQSPEVVSCELPVADIEKIHYWARDYLTTSAGFIQYSLVAVFGLGDRGKMELL